MAAPRLCPAHGQAVIPAGSDRCDGRHTTRLHWQIVIRSTAVAQLARVVAPPAPSRAACLDSERMVEARSHVGSASEAGNLDWCVSVRICTIADLTVPVIAPGPRRSVGLECQTEFITRGNRDDPAQIPNAARS